MNPNELSPEILSIIKHRFRVLPSTSGEDVKRLLGHIDALTQRLQEVGQKAVDDFTSAHHSPIVSQKNEEIRRLAERAEEAEKAAGFCDKHKPDGGARNCLVCGVEKLSFALSRISYLCGEPNEMRQSDYDTHFNEEEVVKQVEHLKCRLNASEIKCAELRDGISVLNDLLVGYGTAGGVDFNKVSQQIDRLQALSSTPNVSEWVRKSDLRGVGLALNMACVASCNCMTKTPEPEFHAESCHYKMCRSALNLLESITGKAQL